MDRETDSAKSLAMFRRRWSIILAVPILSLAGVVILVTFIMTPVYEASSTLLIGRNEIGNPQAGIGYQDILLNQQLVKTYSEIAKSDTVLERVAGKMELTMSPEQLRKYIKVSPVAGTQIIRLSTSDADPLLAQAMTNTTASVFAQRVSELMKLNNVTIVDPARTPLVPVKPRKMLAVATALALGVVTALGLAFLAESLDNTVKSREEAELLLDLPVLGVVPKITTATLGGRYDEQDHRTAQGVS